MQKREIYNYKQPKYAPLRDVMRGVMQAYGEAERFFATVKETVWGRFGLLNLASYIHALEHIQPEAVDNFKMILAEHGLEVEYPPISELSEEIDDIDKVFEICVAIIDNTDEALHAFITLLDRPENKQFFAMARRAENLLMQNSRERIFLLEAWSVADNHSSLTSFDRWIKANAPYLHDEGDSDD